MYKCFYPSKTFYQTPISQNDVLSLEAGKQYFYRVKMESLKFKIKVHVDKTKYSPSETGWLWQLF